MNSNYSERNQDNKLDQEEMEENRDMLDNPKYLSAPKGNVLYKHILLLSAFPFRMMQISTVKAKNY